MRLKGKSIIVTGGGSGFGAAMSRRFAAEGAKVLVADLNLDGASEVARSIGSAAVACKVDVASGAEFRTMVAKALEAFGDVDSIVNNAGTSHRNGPILEIDEATFDKVYDVNVKSIFHIGSTAGIRPRPGLTWYNGSKAAVNLISKSLAVELAPDKVRVNCICPVIGATALLETFMGVPDTPENRARFIATIPLGRMSDGEDIASAAVYLISDEANFITGVLLPVDGGRTV
jgi:3-oxoacyl-[acyl-carrier protein] reductase